MMNERELLELIADKPTKVQMWAQKNGMIWSMDYGTLLQTIAKRGLAAIDAEKKRKAEARKKAKSA